VFIRARSNAEHGFHVIVAQNILPLAERACTGAPQPLPPRKISLRSLKEPRLSPNLARHRTVHRQVHQVYPLMTANRRHLSNCFSHCRDYATPPHVSQDPGFSRRGSRFTLHPRDFPSLVWSNTFDMSQNKVRLT
jgi:hypothetical protein